MNQDHQRKWNLQELKKETGFNNLELDSAIGWLAREDKIQVEFHNAKDPKACLYLMLNVYI